MAILFMGGEDIDFTAFLGASYPTAGNGRSRPGFARGSLSVTGGGDDLANRIMGTFAAPSSAFWLATRTYFTFLGTTGNWRTFLALYEGGTPRIGVQMQSLTRLVRFVIFDASGNPGAVAATSVPAVQGEGLQRLDLQVVHGTSGRLNLYVNGVSVLDWSGSTVIGTQAPITDFGLASAADSSVIQTDWSEIIAIERDSRTLSLKTNGPVATAQGHQWLGDQSDVNEVVANKDTMLTTTAVNQSARFTIDPMPAGNYAVRGFKVGALAVAGINGPQSIALGVGTNGSDSLGPAQPLDTGWTPVSQTFETNPVTNAPWTTAEINAVQIEAQSRT
jgi:hypothetical protein